MVDKFFCRDCNKFFDEPETYQEKHNLDNPPYERVAICPKCKSDNYFSFSSKVEKTDVAEKLLPVVMWLNRHISALKNIFGNGAKSIELCDSVEVIAELICEMYEFLDVDVQRKILEIECENDINKILLYLNGEL